MTVTEGCVLETSSLCRLEHPALLAFVRVGVVFARKAPVSFPQQVKYVSKQGSRMRINLSCPYAEKDLAKSLGARWDIARKVWYIVDIEDLTPFMRWIGGQDNGRRLEPFKSKAHSPRNNLKAGATTKSAYVHDCGCDHVLPWEYCEHKERAAQTAMREMIA